jgi:hypothetical protein
VDSLTTVLWHVTALVVFLSINPTGLISAVKTIISFLR